MTQLQQLEPASAKALPWQRVDALFKSPDWYAEPKLDGWRFLMHLGGGLDRIYLTGRRISTKTGLFSEKGECVDFTPTTSRGRKHLRRLAYTVIDGEVMPPDGASFRDLASIMNVHPEKARTRIAEIGHPTFQAFDCLYANGKDIRRVIQRPIFSDHGRNIMGQNITHDLDLPHFAWLTQTTADKLDLYETEIARGNEGVILKNWRTPYGEGWVKVKRTHTLDVVVMRATEANEGKTGKFKGLIGALVVGVYRKGKLVEVGQVSGMTDRERRMFTRNRDRLVGMVLEIKAQELAKDRLRHPRYSRIRVDVPASKCTMRRMLRDLEAHRGGQR